jgi:hypothetical protein
MLAQHFFLRIFISIYLLIVKFDIKIHKFLTFQQCFYVTVKIHKSFLIIPLLLENYKVFQKITRLKQFLELDLPPFENFLYRPTEQKVQCNFKGC